LLLSPQHNTATVLIVEDDHALRELYRATLIAEGYTVVAVEDGIDALRYIEGHIPSLVLLDLVLPRLHGRDVQRELASHPETRSIPIVVVTGSDTRDLPASDFNGLLKKPVSTDTLLAAVEHALRNAHLERSTKPGIVKTHRPQARTVLVVDDEVTVQKFLTHFLEEKGYGVETAGSVGEAILVLDVDEIRTGADRARLGLHLLQVGQSRIAGRTPRSAHGLTLPFGQYSSFSI